MRDHLLDEIRTIRIQLQVKGEHTREGQKLLAELSRKTKQWRLTKTLKSVN